MKADQLFSLAGQSAIVTGGARGLGLAMAEVLHANGASVSIFDMDPSVFDAARSLDPSGNTVNPVLVDVCDADALHAAIRDGHDRFGRLDIICANAGRGTGSGPSADVGRLEHVDDVAWASILDLNLTAAMHTIQYAVPYMRRQGYGRVVVTSSMAGLRGEPLIGYAYASTKAAIANLVRLAAYDLGRDNIVINAIAPGPFRTDIGNRRMFDPEVEQAFAARVPLGRLGVPQEIKGLALLLASPAASYINGSVISIDGGSVACG